MPGADPIPVEMGYRVGKGLEASADPLESLFGFFSMVALGPPQVEWLKCGGPSTFPEAQEAGGGTACNVNLGEGLQRLPWDSGGEISPCCKQPQPLQK